MAKRYKINQSNHDALAADEIMKMWYADIQVMLKGGTVEWLV